MAKKTSAPAKSPVQARRTTARPAPVAPPKKHNNPNMRAAAQPQTAKARTGSTARPAARTSTRAAGSTREPAQPRKAGYKVRATQLGYYEHERKREGDVFVLKYEHDFAANWMERVDPRTAPKTTTGQEVLRQQHEEVRRQRSTGMQVDIDNPLDGPDPIGAGDNDE